MKEVYFRQQEMKLAFIILSHKLPEQLHRLVSRLDDAHAAFVIHLCRNTTKDDFKKAHELLDKKPNVFFCKREDGSWGGFGIVQAVLNGMELLEKKKVDYDYINVISGNDYPIKSNEFLKGVFKKNYGKEFLWHLPIFNYVPEPVSEGTIYGEGWRGNVHPWGNRLLRVEKYWFSILGERLMIIPETRFLGKPLWSVFKIFLHDTRQYLKEGKWKREFLLMLLSLTHQQKRIYPEGFTPCAGSQWFSITKTCVEYILKTHRETPELKKYFQHVLLPDESFFTTIIVNSRFRENIAQNNYRYIRWEGEDRSHPVILKKADLPLLKKSDKLFARKFDCKRDSEILDLIDRELL